MLVSGPASWLNDTAADRVGAPIVLDEAEHRALIGQRVIDEIRLGEGRDDDQRQPQAIAAAALDRRAVRLLPVDAALRVLDQR
jgi:hypothetical protein